MAIRDIVKFPDPRLRQPAAPIAAFDATLSALSSDLLDTMRAAPGIGITGPHIGEPWRITVIEMEPGDVRIYVNPQITWWSEDLQVHTEGSISMPGASATLERPGRVRVRYVDLAGCQQIEEAEGLLAVCLQHEIDQLDGVFWTQRLSRLKRDILLKKWNKQQKRLIGPRLDV